MTTAELIAKLREIDPEGVEDVVVDDYDARTVELVDKVHYTRITGREPIHVRYVLISS